MSTLGALVIGGDYRGLGLVRSLGRRGIPVWVAQDEHTLAGRSRFAARRLRWPSDPARQIDLLEDLARHHGLAGWTVFPTTDAAAAFLARSHHRLAACFRLTVPPWDVLRWAFDKRLLYGLAEKIGVDTPRRYLAGSRAEIEAAEIRFPVIVKPAYVPDHNPFTDAKAWAAVDRAALVRRYDDACAYVDPDLVMIQELIPGGGEAQRSYAALCVAGRPRASVTARRRRQWPTDFGRASSFVETVDDPEVEEAATRLLRALNFDGLVEIEFKRDARDGRLKLLDANPRVWGWHSIGRRAGVDFPYLAWSLSNGRAVPELRGRPGVRWVRALIDVPAAAAEMRAGRLSPGAYLRGLVGATEFAILAMDDPAPAILEAPLALAVALRRRSGRAEGLAARAQS